METPFENRDRWAETDNPVDPDRLAEVNRNRDRWAAEIYRLDLKNDEFPLDVHDAAVGLSARLPGWPKRNQQLLIRYIGDRSKVLFAKFQHELRGLTPLGNPGPDFHAFDRLAWRRLSFCMRACIQYAISLFAPAILQNDLAAGQVGRLPPARLWDRGRDRNIGVSYRATHIVFAELTYLPPRPTYCMS